MGIVVVGAPESVFAVTTAVGVARSRAAEVDDTRAR